MSGTDAPLAATCFCGNQAKWNSNEEVARILYSAQNHPEWISNEIRLFPPSTSLKLYRRLDGAYFKQDGYEWKRRKEGKLIREDHVKLKVQKMDTIYGSYVHSALVPSFHRRTYWLFERPDIVLVHYLNVTAEEIREGQPLHVRIAQSIIASGQNFTRSQIEQQIRPIFYCSMHTSDLESLLGNVFKLLDASSNVLNVVRTLHPDSPSKVGNDYAAVDSAELGRISSMSHTSLCKQHSSSSDTIDRMYQEGDASRNSRKFGNLSGVFGCETVDGEVHALLDDSRSVCSPSWVPIYGARRSSHVFDDSHPCFVDIIDFSPDRSPTKGCTKVLLVGGWCHRGHDYAVMFGNRQVPATLFHAGVLRCLAPPHSAGSVHLRVFCDGMLISKSAQFTYFDPGTREERILMMRDLSQRLAYLQSCLTLSAESCVPQLPDELNEEAVIKVLNEMMQYAFNQTLLSAPTRLNETRSLLHICAALDYYRAVQIILQWRSRMPSSYYIRDFDVLARDSEGRTPLHYAVLHTSIYSIETLISCCRSTLEVVDDRGETPQDLAFKLSNSDVANAIVRSTNMMTVSQGHSPLAVNVTSPTALWVLTNGKSVSVDKGISGAQQFSMLQNDHSVSNLSASAANSFVGEANSEVNTVSTDSGAQNGSDRGSWLDGPLSMEVPIPDSPTTAGMWKALASLDTSTHEVARERMASLAQQIIDALPERIKKVEEDMEPSCFDEVVSFSELSSSGLSVHSKNPFLPSVCYSTSNDWEELASPYQMTEHGGVDQCIQSSSHAEAGFFDVLDGTLPSFSLLPPSSAEPSNPLDRSNDIQPVKKTAKDMGEFFNSGGTVGPIERYFQNLRLTDREQRELFEAAKIIQHAYRQYKARITTQRQNEAERNAAIVIQSYYRRYKQYCYFKKLHKAAVLIQKHYRMHKALQKQRNNYDAKYDSSLQLEDAHPDAALLWKEHQAAVTIQHAYRGHYQRKRQAAARKIQKFMRQSRQKLRKIPESSDGVCSAANP